MLSKETIVAQATASGQSGVAIIRLSGEQSVKIATKLFKEGELKPRNAYFKNCFDRNAQILDECLIIFFKAPNSFTGEDVVEIQCHGNPVVINKIINEACFYGARLAKPGEFSERAFLNGKIDLVQAEAIADLISSQSETAVKNAIASLKGVFSEKINELNSAIVQTRCYLEAAIDFPDEEGVDFISEGKIKEKLEQLTTQLEKILNSANQGVIFQEGINVVLAGEPNVGKSSLLNQLTKQESAIVTEIAGTTRDVLRERVQLKGIPLNVIDTAGLRESTDPIEQEGIKRALKEIQSADFIFYLFSSEKKEGFTQQEAWQTLLQHNKLENLQGKTIIIGNKIDLLGKQADIETKKIEGKAFKLIYLSAKDGSGLDLLEKEVLDVLGIQQSEEGVFAARRRHIEALNLSREYLDHAYKTLETGTGEELVAEDLRLAHRTLGEITGEFSPDDLLGAIFSSFCIGK